MPRPKTYVLQRIPFCDRGNPETALKPGRKYRMRLESGVVFPALREIRDSQSYRKIVLTRVFVPEAFP
jgi:hypothetical protein